MGFVRETLRSGNIFLVRAVVGLHLSNKWERFEVGVLSYLSSGRLFVVVCFDLVMVGCGDQFFELELDMEASAERKAHSVGLVGEERQCVLDYGGFLERGWMYRLFWFVRCDDVLQLYISSGCGYGRCYKC